jgi:SAM-dependent methyltransferase
MANKPKIQPPAVSPESYTREYFECWCQGANEFKVSGGMYLPLRLRKVINLAKIREGDWILDVGCGRGELVLHCAMRGAQALGIDYASSALEFAQEITRKLDNKIKEKVGFIKSDARFLPFQDGIFDVVFMIDVVEHLTPDELDQSLQEIRRVLKDDGRFIIHTMPNLWYYKFIYPLYRIFQGLRGIKLPVDPRDRWQFKEVHVNEQTPISLYRFLRKNGFRAKVFLESTQAYETEKNILVRKILIVLTKLPIFKLLFCNDIFAVATKTR